MSKTVDERVVSMQFDNRQFEANVKTSMTTLEKLKQKLNFKDTSQSLDALGQASRKVDMTRLGEGIQTVGLRFSAMYTIADQVLRNITTRVQQTAERMAKAFTLDPIKSGLQEYETQIGAVQTILANTSSKGTTLLEVNAALDELNKYADMTIYNFTEMTRNIGTFTAAGIGLQDSVDAIQGIANLAAISGSTSQQASTAMYQLSQALASGTVKLMDWNSVVNAGMGGQVFQDALKRTARQMGIQVDKMIEKAGSFRESLSEGWITSEVLTETLKQLAGVYTEAELIAQGYSESQAKEIIKLGQTATDAATKVKTLTQLFDTLKEALQSGWTQTWEIIIGDFEEAKELWTAVSDTVGDIINKSSDKRNRLLSGALDTNWEKLVAKLNEAGIETAKFEERTKKVLEEHGYDVEELIEKYGSLDRVFREGAVGADILFEVLNGIGESAAAIDLTGIGRTLKNGMRGEDVKLMQEALDYLGYKLPTFGIDGIFGAETRAALMEFQKVNGLEPSGILDDATLAALSKEMSITTEATDLLSESCKEYINNIEELGGRELLIDGLKNAFAGLMNFLRPVGLAFSEIFKGISSEQLFGYIQRFHELTTAFRKLAAQSHIRTMFSNMFKTFRGLFAAVDIVARVVGGALVAGFKALGKALSLIAPRFFEVTGSMGEAITKFREWLLEEGRIAGIFSALGTAVKSGIDILKGWVKAFFELPAVQKVISRFKEIFMDTFGGVYERIQAFIARIREMDGITLDNLGAILTDFKENVLNYFFNLDNPFERIKDALVEFWENITTYFSSIEGKFSGLRETITNFFSIIKEKLGDNMGTILAVGVLITFLAIINKIKKAVTLLATPFGAIEGIGEAMGGVLGGLTKKLKSEALKNLATSIAILAASVAVLALLPIKNVWSSVGAIAALATMLIVVSKMMNSVQNIPELGKASLAIMGIGAALLLLGIAAKIIASVPLPAIVNTISLIIALVGAVLLIDKFATNTGDIAAFGLTMALLGKALLSLSVAVYILGHMDGKTLLQGGGAVFVFLGMMVGMMAATKLIRKKLPEFGGTMIALSFSLLLMSAAVAALGSMDGKTLLQGGGAVFLFLGMMVGMMAATNLIAKGLKQFGATMLGLSASLLLMGLAVRILANIDPVTFVKGSTVLISLIGIMSLMMLATRALSKHLMNGMKIGGMMLAFATSILILAGAIALLSLIDAEKMFTAVTAIGALTVMMVGLLVATKFAAGEIAGVIGLAVAIGILAVAVAALSFIEPAKLYAATGALTIIMGMMAILVKSTGLLQKGLLPALALAGIVLILSGALILMSYLEVKDALANAAGLSILILSLAGAAALLGLINPAGALSAVGSLAVFIAGLMTVLIALGAISYIPGLNKVISKGGELLYNIGQAFGKLIGGFSAGVTAGLPTIGANLSRFAILSAPFFALMSKLKPETMSAVNTLANVILKLASAELIDSISGWIGKKNDLTDFATKLTSFADAMMAFSAKVTDMKAGDIKQIGLVAEAASKLVDVANAIPKTGGTMQRFFGTRDLSTFADELIPLGESIVDLAELTKEIKSGDIQRLSNIATAIKKYVEIANSIPENDGLLRNLLSVQSLAVFSEDLKTIGPAVQSLAATTDGIDSTAITRIKNIGTAILAYADVASTLPDQYSWFESATGWTPIFAFSKGLAQIGRGVVGLADETKDVNSTAIKRISDIGVAIQNYATVAGNLPDYTVWENLTGLTDIKTFADGLTKLGSGISTFAKKTATVDEAAITRITLMGGAIDALAGAAKKVNDYKDRGWLNTNLTEFATELMGTGKEGDHGVVGGGFGAALSSFSTSIADVDTEKIGTVMDSVNRIVAMCRKLNSDGYDPYAIYTFGAGIEDFGANIANMYTSIADVDTDKIDSAITAAERLKTLGSGKKGKKLDFSFLSGIDEQLGKLGGDGVKQFVSTFENAADAAEIAGGKFITYLTNGMRLAMTKITDAASEITDSAVDVLEDAYSSFRDSGEYLAEGLAKGIKAGKSGVVSSAVAIATAAVVALKAALLIKSPSRVAYGIGGFFGEGFVDGIDSYGRKSYSAGESMANYARKGLTNAISSVATFLEDGIDTQPTIRPVLDLSDVTSGAGAINGMFSMHPAVGVMANVGSISSMMNRSQNGANSDVVSAIEALGRSISDRTGDTYQINGVTYDDGSSVSDAVRTLVRAAKVERRI